MKTSRSALRIYQLKITLIGSKPPIWRRILVRSDVALPTFHFVLQASMGWQGGHLHAFRAGHEFYGELMDDMDDMKDESKVKLDKLLRKEKDSLIYEYDFGDGWEHKILLEKILAYDETIKTPVCIKGKLACPPEDCGGIWGYYELLETLKDPHHPDHEDMKEWVGGELDPEFFDIAEVNALLAPMNA
ncbi:MAG: plasmid pRiA4b ORF-3 family protein [Methylococcaceae bacterium]|nr:plasmid pRiA4b ORF-3 family protein [Methylococcaceae bacterium]